ncbi:MAG: glycerophosphodiester phosphodiesterase [Clostridia bacterium]|nr:glycerophosphodiester phosphodiesterase [Clostridia bacterium]
MKNLFDSWIVKTPIAHRGLHDKHSPENSLSAFKKAIDKNYAIEIDVQMTKDGVIVVFHDDFLDRMTNATGDLREKTFDEIKNLYLKNSTERIPTFREFLSLVDGKTPVLIEIKDHKNIGILEEKLTKQLLRYNGEFALQSFNPYITKWFKQNTNFCAGILSCFFCDVKLAWYKKLMLKNLYLLKNVKADFVSYEANAGYTFNKLKKLKNKKPILFWTVKSIEDMQRYNQVCDNVIFENFLP